MVRSPQFPFTTPGCRGSILTELASDRHGVLTGMGADFQLRISIREYTVKLTLQVPTRQEQRC